MVRIVKWEVTTLQKSPRTCSQAEFRTPERSVRRPFFLRKPLALPPHEEEDARNDRQDGQHIAAVGEVHLEERGRQHAEQD
jgi:hypothetical protein